MFVWERLLENFSQLIVTQCPDNSYVCPCLNNVSAIGCYEVKSRFLFADNRVVKATTDPCDKVFDLSGYCASKVLQ